MVRVPPRAVDGPGAARELVAEPVVRGGVHHLVPRDDVVELALDRAAGPRRRTPARRSRSRSSPARRRRACTPSRGSRTDAPGRMAFCCTAGPRARMKTLRPVDAWPAAIAARLPAGSGGSNSIDGSAFSGKATIAERAAIASPPRRCTSTPDSDCETAATGDSSRTSNEAPPAIAASSAPVPSRERHAPAGVLGERQAVAGERVPAKHAHGARLLERAARERLELGHRARTAPQPSARARPSAR